MIPNLAGARRKVQGAMGTVFRLGAAIGRRGR